MSQFEVIDLSGNKLTLQSQDEADMYDKAQGKYVSEFTFTLASDERAIDRLVMMEVLCFRWNSQLLSGVDQNGRPLPAVQVAAYQKYLKDGGSQIQDMMQDLGITKTQRDKEAQDGPGAYLDNLLLRAREFGIHREEQADKALEMLKEIFGHTGAYLRSNAFEREKLELTTAEAVLKLIMTRKKEFDELDEYFRNKPDGQKYWIREI